MRRALTIIILWVCVAASGSTRSWFRAIQGQPTVPAKPVIGFLAMAWTNTTSAYSTYTVPNNYQIPANAVAIALVQNSKAYNPEVPTLTGNNVTWTALGTTNFGSGTNRATVFWAQTNATTPSGKVTTSSLSSATGAGIYVCIFTNTATTSPIQQSLVVTGTNDTSMSITMSALDASGRNAVIVCLGNTAGNGAQWAVPDSGWTEAWDIGYNSPASGEYIFYSVATTDNTPSLNTLGSSQPWGGVAVEIKAVP